MGSTVAPDVALFAAGVGGWGRGDEVVCTCCGSDLVMCGDRVRAGLVLAKTSNPQCHSDI